MEEVIFSAAPLLSDVVKRHGLLMRKKEKKKKREHTFSENEVFREKWVVGGESRRRDK